MPTCAAIDYHLVGTSAALLHGVVLPAADIDILVRKRSNVDAFGLAQRLQDDVLGQLGQAPSKLITGYDHLHSSNRTCWRSPAPTPATMLHWIIRTIATGLYRTAA
jgi:hypothetical protein